MNCKAGDLAIITKIPEQWMVFASTEMRQTVMKLIGTIVRCVKPGKPNISGHPTWVLEKPLPLDWCLLTEIEDLVLTPIRGGNIDMEETKEKEAV